MTQTMQMPRALGATDGRDEADYDGQPVAPLRPRGMATAPGPAPARPHQPSHERLDLLASLRGAENAHSISGAARGAEADTFNVAALGAATAALVGLVVMPLPMGVASLCLGGKALLAIKSTGQSDGKGMAVFGVALGLVNLGFWAIYTMAFFGEVKAS